MSKLFRYEQKTIINFNAGEKKATVYTADPAVMGYLGLLVIEFPVSFKCIKVNGISRTYGRLTKYRENQSTLEKNGGARIMKYVYIKACMNKQKGTLFGGRDRWFFQVYIFHFSFCHW